MSHHATPARTAHRKRVAAARMAALPRCAVCAQHPVGTPGTACSRCRQAATNNGRSKWKPGVGGQIRSARKELDIPLVGVTSWWLSGESFYLRAKAERGRIMAQGLRWTRRTLTDGE